VRAKGLADRGFDRLSRDIERLMEDAKNRTVEVARANTPIKTGRARNNWAGNQTSQGFEVENSVPYIEQLDKGKSRQAPNGIIKPTVRTMTGYIKSRRLKR
jgi:hypothetical protein